MTNLIIKKHNGWPRSTIVEVRAPVGVRRAFNVVATRVFCKGGDRLNRAQAVVRVNDLEVTKIAGTGEPLLRKPARSHLRRRVLAVGAGVDDLAAPLNHRRPIREVREELRRPIADQHAVSEAHPPAPQLRILPNENGDVKLAVVKGRDRRYRSSYRDLVVSLNESRA